MTKDPLLACGLFRAGVRELRPAAAAAYRLRSTTTCWVRVDLVAPVSPWRRRSASVRAAGLGGRRCLGPGRCPPDGVKQPREPESEVLSRQIGV